jgi:hypothetical protein
MYAPTPSAGISGSQANGRKTWQQYGKRQHLLYPASHSKQCLPDAKMLVAKVESERNF